ncbi:MAG: selenocysteine-specific translation elongation factor [Chthoniobacterales bacterium]|nr:selenocysteine-specific translation elongation factor [Chthoniobacterales bacterium]
MTPQNFILATAGHVDHGKTALVKALTGTDTDRLPEEKARGMTIDLGFAHLSLPGFSLGIIDVPGHEDFVRNMIAGLGAIDLVLFVVAADDGWMPQSEEHLQILDYLGIQHGVVAITKCDLGDANRIEEEVRQQLRGTSLGKSPVVLTSVRNSLGIDHLCEELARQCAQIPASRDVGKPRLFVDRAFSIRGSGTVVTGTLIGGHLTRGDTLVVQPQDSPVRIRAIQSHNEAVETAAPATRVALNLPDRRVEDIPRGSLLTTIMPGTVGRAVDVLLTRSARLSPVTRALKSGALFQFYHGSARHKARVTLLEQRELKPGERAVARMVFAEPIHAYAGDRFILRDSSERHTVAGGLILDPDAAGTKFRSVAQRHFLDARAVAPNDPNILLETQLARDGWAKEETLLLKSDLSRDEIEAVVAELVRAQKIFRAKGIVAEAAWWLDLCDRAQKLIDAAHRQHPQQAGSELSATRSALQIEDTQLFDALVRHLCAHGFERVGNAIRRRGHRPALPPQLQRAGAEIRAALAAQPFDPPSRKQLIRDAAAREALRFLAETGEVVLLGDDVLLGAATFVEMKSRIQQSLGTKGPATASELRQLLGTSRRILIPLLEHLDRVGLTVRQGDRRALRQSAPAR